MESIKKVDQHQRGGARSQGRPRDTRIDDAVLRATVELLQEIGYTRLTIPLVAARAGATPPAVYRRFPTKIELVYQAVFPGLPSAESALAGDLESGVRALIRASIDLFSRPAVHTAISGLMAEMPSEPGLSARLLSRFQDDTYILLQQFLDTAAAEGREWKWAVGPRAGYVFPPDADNGTWTAGVQFRYYPWQLLAFETSVDFHKEQHEDGDIETSIQTSDSRAVIVLP